MTTRMLHLLSELKRQMNGAVASSMRFYGAEYGLNYGVSIPTMRTLARAETQDHKFAKYLYQQDIRELRLLSLWLANPADVNNPQELNFWEQGVINSEVAEEAAFALLHKVPCVEVWLYRDNEILQYCALMSLASSHDPEFGLKRIGDRLQSLLMTNPSLLPKGVVALLSTIIRRGGGKEVRTFIDSMAQNSATKFVESEISWQL